MTAYPLINRARFARDAISALATHSTAADDPLGSLRDGVLGAFDVYNILASTTEPPHPTISLTAQE